MAGSIREALEQAVAKQSSAPAETPVAATPAASESVPVAQADSSVSTETTPAKDENPYLNKPAAKKPWTGEPAAIEEPAVAKSTDENVPTDGAQSPPTNKAPQSWKPAVREHWNKIPVEAQAEITRRENEIQQGLSRAAIARKSVEEYERVIQPFQGIIRSSGVTPHQAIHNLMNTAAGLQVGTQQQKAAIVTDIIKSFNVDVQVLDALLAGQPAQPGSAPSQDIDRILNERLAPVNNLLSEVMTARQQREQETQAQVDRELSEFAQVEFFEDLREDMADIMEIKGKRGQRLTLKDAYDLALEYHPEIKKIVSGRRAAVNGAQAVNAAASRAVSIGRTTPSGIGPAPTANTSTVRNALEAAAANLSRRT